MIRYWTDGANAVSVNEICKWADVSKPGLYREFGNEDGLKQAALTLYSETVLMPLFELLERDLPFQQCLADVREYASQDRRASGIPDGCLLANMTHCKGELGTQCNEQVEAFNDQMLQNFATWIERGKASQELTMDISVQAAALYIKSQINAATELQRAGEKPKTINDFLQLAFSVFA